MWAKTMCYIQVQWLPQGKALVQLLELQVQLITFFMEHHLYLKEQLTDQQWLCRLGYLADIFSKMNKMSLLH